MALHIQIRRPTPHLDFITAGHLTLRTSCAAHTPLAAGIRLGVIAVVFFQLVTVLLGGYVLPAGLIALRHPLGWIGRLANFAVLIVTAIALWISYGRR